MQLINAITDRVVRQDDEFVDESKQFGLDMPDVSNFNNYIGNDYIPPVDSWVAAPEDEIFKPLNGKRLMAPLAKVLTNDDEEMIMFDTFCMGSKKCYSSEETLAHYAHYMNYLEKYFDQDHELLMIYARLKFLIDTDENHLYTVDNLMRDVRNMILFSSFAYKVKAMNEQNYIIHIKKNKRDGNVLQYSNRHLLAIMEISLFQIILIPILAHYAYINSIKAMDPYLMRFFDVLIDEMHPDIDIIAKLTETTNSRIIQDMAKNAGSWDQQYIRGKNKYSHRLESIVNIITQILPKSRYCQNTLNYIYVALKNNNRNNVVAAKYEYSFRQLSSDRNDCDDDDNSEFDKFESHLSKKNEALLLHNQVNFRMTMKKIEERFGPFSKDEIDYYRVELCRGRKTPIVPLQKTLVCYLFYKWFGDPSSLGSMDLTNYIKLIIAAKRILAINGLHTMEAIISGKFVKVINRTNMNKKELAKIQASPTYIALSNIYKNPKIDEKLISILSIIIASKFQIIDFNNKEATGTPFIPQQELLNEEFLLYATLINNGCNI